jgi:hypothetical protein
MRVVCRFVGIAIIAVASAAVDRPAAAQTAAPAMTPLEVEVACGPPPTLEAPAEPLRVVGVQDTMKRVVFSTADTLVINGGSDKGLQLGQQYFVRRPIIFGSDRKGAKAIVTLGWLRVNAVNETTALATLDRFCGAIHEGDYLEPFVAPSVPASFAADDASGELNFATLNRIVTGAENQSSVSGGMLMLIDRGSEQDTQPGMRFAVYRDVHAAGLPLAAVGEGVVVSVGKSLSVARITRSRDAVIPGDYVVPRK